jgi:hypothetical protein
VPWLRGPRPADQTDDAIRRHYEAFFAGARIAYVSPVLPPHVDRVLHGLQVAIIDRDGTSVLATVGGRRGSAGQLQHLEFLIAARDPEGSIEYPAMLAYYHAVERLDVGHMLPMGQPLVPGSNLRYWLISLPYPWGPQLERLTVKGREIRVLWAIPITLEERLYRIQHGLDALEQRFEEQDLNYIEPLRPSLVAADEVTPE